MPDFQCDVCSSEFTVAQAALDRYPGWTPRYCRDHSPQKKSKTTKTKAKKKRSSSGSREENLTLKQVLEKYTDGPRTGVFTDGGAHPNPGPGGWGMVRVEDGRIVAEDRGHEAKTTNNRMELTALIAAFKVLPTDAAATVYSDSRLCVDTITKWASGWERRGWTRKGEPLKNLDLIKELFALYRARPKAKLEWIAAHSGYRWNEYADSLASSWRRDEL